MSSKRNICSIHDDIINECKNLIKNIAKCNVSDSSEELCDVLYDIQWQLNYYIIPYTEEAKEYGRSMENRLSDYRSTIEGLGFTRTK